MYFEQIYCEAIRPLDSGALRLYHGVEAGGCPHSVRFIMPIVDALHTVFDFFLSFILAGQVPQDNSEAEVYNFFTILINLLGFLGFTL